MPGLFGKDPGINGNMNQNGGNMKKLSRVATIAVAAAGWIMTCAGISNAGGSINAEREFQGVQVSPSGSATGGTTEDSISESPGKCTDRPGACISVKKAFTAHEVDVQGSTGVGAGGATSGVPDEPVNSGIKGTTDDTGSDRDKGDGVTGPSE